MLSSDRDSEKKKAPVDWRRKSLEPWLVFFPPHLLKKETFIATLDELIEKRDGNAVLSFWATLKNEGTMYNILYAMPPMNHSEIKLKIYTISAFLTVNQYKEYKKMLESGFHVMELKLAMMLTPPNKELIDFFIVTGKPRGRSVNVSKWIWNTLKSIVDREAREKLFANCFGSMRCPRLSRTHGSSVCGRFLPAR